MFLFSPFTTIKSPFFCLNGKFALSSPGIKYASGNGDER